MAEDYFGAPPDTPDDGGWPNCETPDCENKRCCWSGLSVCFPCAERVIGYVELIRRFDATHDLTWVETLALEELERKAGQ